MMWALPPGAVATVVVAAALAWFACALARRNRVRLAVLCIFIAALLIRMYASADQALHAWDERYHALVAKNLMSNPLTPVLYSRPLLDYDYAEWTANHVWLHKPPLALWAMAASMKVFGVSEAAMRLPSLLASSATPVVTFGIGTALFDRRVGLLAAMFQAFNGLLVSLAAGRRASDHVDTLLIFLVALGVLVGLRVRHGRPQFAAYAVGAITGLALLTKSLAGLVMLPIWPFLLQRPGPLRTVIRHFLLAILVAVAVAAPWTVYTSVAFPLEAAHERMYAIRHITDVLEGQGGPPWQYLLEMPRFFGELVFLPLVWCVFTVVRRRASGPRRAMLIWWAVPYLVYSMFSTKMPAYVMVAAPAVFIVEAEFWLHLRQRVTSSRSRTSRVFLVMALGLLAVLPARYLLEPTGPLERRERQPQWVRDLKSLEAGIDVGDAVVFNVSRPIEAMFYTGYTVYSHIPDEEELRRLDGYGLRLFVYDDGQDTFRVPGDVRLEIIRPLR